MGQKMAAGATRRWHGGLEDDAGHSSRWECGIQVARWELEEGLGHGRLRGACEGEATGANQQGGGGIVPTLICVHCMMHAFSRRRVLCFILISAINRTLKTKTGFQKLLLL